MSTVALPARRRWLASLLIAARFADSVGRRLALISGLCRFAAAWSRPIRPITICHIT